MGELALKDDAHAPVARPGEGNVVLADTARVLDMIASAATNPSVDVAKMQALLDMQERVLDRNARAAFMEAFARLQDDLPSIRKDGAITNKTGQVQSRYSKWETMHRIISPIIRRHGFTLSFRNGSDGRGVAVEAMLAGYGHVESSGLMPVPADTSGNKNAAQAMGSAASYGKRYATIMLLNIVTEEDDDAQSAKAPPPAPDLDGLEDARMQGREVAEGNGMAAYREWWATQPVTIRNAMMADGSHDANKVAAEKSGVPF